MQVRKCVLTPLGECDQCLVKLLHQGDVILKFCDSVKHKHDQLSLISILGVLFSGVQTQHTWVQMMHMILPLGNDFILNI